MEFTKLRMEEQGPRITLTLDRPEKHNALNTLLLQELHAALDQLQRFPNCRLLVLQGHPTYFCSGMDLKEVALQNEEIIKHWTTLYATFLKRLSSIPQVVVALPSGKVLAGGVGLVCASDLVYATPSTYFQLTEAFWGLLPAMVAPYLVRRVGFQQGYQLALTCEQVDAEHALKIHLIDHLSEQPIEMIQKLEQRLMRIDLSTVELMKAYFRKLWIINEEIEHSSIETTTACLLQSKTRDRMRQFVEQHKLPWE